jgi:hypothetical protein
MRACCWTRLSHKQRRERGYHDYARLTAETRDRVATSYYGSWYYQRTKAEIVIPEAFGTHGESIRHYIKAAICEFLIMEGVDIL